MSSTKIHTSDVTQKGHSCNTITTTLKIKVQSPGMCLCFAGGRGRLSWRVGSPPCHGLGVEVFVLVTFFCLCLDTSLEMVLRGVRYQSGDGSTWG